MFHRIVSLALIVCFLPLPNANSVVAWELKILAADSDWSEGTISDESEQIPFGRITHNPMTIDSETLVFCEMENEVRENESKGGEEKSIGPAVWSILSSRHILGGSSRNGFWGGRSGHSADIASRYHVLRC